MSLFNVFFIIIISFFYKFYRWNVIECKVKKWKERCCYYNQDYFRFFIYFSKKISYTHEMCLAFIWDKISFSFSFLFNCSLFSHVGMTQKKKWWQNIIRSINRAFFSCKICLLLLNIFFQYFFSSLFTSISLRDFSL